MSKGFRDLLREGIRKFAEQGYSSETDLQEWLSRLHAALERELPTDEQSRAMLARILSAVYAREVKGGVGKRIAGVQRYTIDRVAPHLRAELDRRIFAAADLIRLNKRKRVEQTLQRFAGWITAQRPDAPAPAVREVAAEIVKPTAQLKFEARRVAIDQAAKLSAAIAHVVAKEAGAIAAIWHDRGQYDHGYDARPEHIKRSGKLFLIRDSWAVSDGLMVARGGVQYTDDLDEQPAQLPYCSCWFEFATDLEDVPPALLTAKGKLYLSGERARSA